MSTAEEVIEDIKRKLLKIDGVNTAKKIALAQELIEVCARHEDEHGTTPAESVMCLSIVLAVIIKTFEKDPEHGRLALNIAQLTMAKAYSDA